MPTENRRLAQLLKRAGHPCEFCDSRRVLSRGPIPICSIALPNREDDGTGNLIKMHCYLAVLTPEDHARAAGTSSDRPTAGAAPEQLSFFS